MSIRRIVVLMSTYVGVSLLLVISVYAQAAESMPRISGEDRYATSANIALDAFEDGVDHVLLVRGESRDNDFADGLAASVLAGALEAPILITPPTELPHSVMDVLVELGPSHVHLLGGEQAVSEHIKQQVNTLDSVHSVTRIGGSNRFATAANIAQQAQVETDTAYIVNGWQSADALVAAVAAYEEGIPILPVEQSSLPQETVQALHDLAIEHVVVIGGRAVVDDDVIEQLAEQGITSERVSGSNREATSVTFAEQKRSAPSTIRVVNGFQLVDAISASVYGDPIVYVRDDAIADVVGTYLLTETAPLVFVGGNVAIDPLVLDTIQEWRALADHLHEARTQILAIQEHDDAAAIVHDLDTLIPAYRADVERAIATYPQMVFEDVLNVTHDEMHYGMQLLDDYEELDSRARFEVGAELLEQINEEKTNSLLLFVERIALAIASVDG